MTPEMKEQLDKDKMQQLHEEQVRFRALTHEVFKQNGCGAQWLKEMKLSFLEKQAVADPNKPEAFAYFREGQNNIIKMISECILLAELDAKKGNKEPSK